MLLHNLVEHHEHYENLRFLSQDRYNTFCKITISLNSIVKLWSILKGLSAATAFANPNSWPTQILLREQKE